MFREDFLRQVLEGQEAIQSPSSSDDSAAAPESASFSPASAAAPPTSGSQASTHQLHSPLSKPKLLQRLQELELELEASEQRCAAAERRSAELEAECGRLQQSEAAAMTAERAALERLEAAEQQQVAAQRELEATAERAAALEARLAAADAQQRKAAAAAAALAALLQHPAEPGMAAAAAEAPGQDGREAQRQRRRRLRMEKPSPLRAQELEAAPAAAGGGRSGSENGGSSSGEDDDLLYYHLKASNPHLDEIAEALFYYDGSKADRERTVGVFIGRVKEAIRKVSGEQASASFASARIELPGLAAALCPTVVVLSRKAGRRLVVGANTKMHMARTRHCTAQQRQLLPGILRCFAPGAVGAPASLGVRVCFEGGEEEVEPLTKEPAKQQAEQPAQQLAEA